MADDNMKGEFNIAYVPDSGDDPKNGSAPVYTTNNEKSDLALPEYSSKASLESGSSDDERAQWGGKWEFLMSCIAMSVGLGNIWRFPFTAYEHGGGAFLIPYIITLILIGRPMYYMEMILGQFTSKGNVQTFASMAPGFQGIGYGQQLSVVAVATYYCSLMAITLHYFFNSFDAVLPWSVCDDLWDNCVDSENTDAPRNGSLSSSELYFTKVVLHQADNIDDGIGAPDWRLTLCLLTSWIFVFVIALKGVKSSGKAAYFLALFPYVVMIIILIRACTLPGAGRGILFFIEPKWADLLNPKVWYAAVSQCFFSLNIGFGSIIMYSSYNNFDHSINRDAMIVSVMDTFTSLLAGVTIFAILGNLAHELDVDIPDVVKSGGTGLAFISYPDAIAKFQQVPQLFAVLFFFMLFVLGIGSLVALQNATATFIADALPSLRHWQVSAGTCIIGFIIGLVYVTPGGQFILTLVDYFAGTFNLYIVTVAEIVVVVWWYGVEDLCLDIEYMLKTKVGAYWRICWSVITPVLLIVILLYSLATMQPLKQGEASFPDSAIASGWVLLMLGVLQIPIWMFVYIHKKRKLGCQQALEATFTRDRWGPKDPQHNKEWREFKKQRWEERNSRGEGTIRYYFNILIGK